MITIIIILPRYVIITHGTDWGRRGLPDAVGGGRGVRNIVLRAHFIRDMYNFNIYGIYKIKFNFFININL
jgi:hypothetical protein